MKFTSLIYPAPSPPSYNCDKLIGELMFIPKDFNEKSEGYITRYATFAKNLSKNHSEYIGRTSASTLMRETVL